MIEYASPVDFETKKEALQVLVDKSILTKTEYDTCVKALKKTVTDKGIIYKDKYISVSYRGFSEENMLGGKGIKIHLIVENKTSAPITIKARKCVNGIIVDKEETVSRDIPEKSKVIEDSVIFYSIKKRTRLVLAWF